MQTERQGNERQGNGKVDSPDSLAVHSPDYLRVLNLARDLSEHRLRRDPTWRPRKIYRVFKAAVFKGEADRDVGAPSGGSEGLVGFEDHGVPGIPTAPVRYEGDQRRFYE